MSATLFATVKAFSQSGLSPFEIISTPQFSSLLNSIDKSIEKRSSTITSISKKRKREEDPLQARKKQALSKLEKEEEYENYRKECWIQYYQWLESQGKKPEEVVRTDNQPTSSIQDEDLEKALLG
jgi:hypothetical protein